MRKIQRLFVLIFAIFILTLSCGKDKKSPTGPGDDPHDIKGLTFVTIPAGTFRMGDIQNYDQFSQEKPVHDVTLSSFEMSIYEVTNAQYAAYLTSALALGDITASSSSVTGAAGEWNEKVYIEFEGMINPDTKLPMSHCQISYSNGTFSVDAGKENHPVQMVSWYGAKEFAKYYGLDLPTEAEWEYACRAGTETYFYTGNNLSGDGQTSTDLDEAGWYSDNSVTGDNPPWTHAVGQKEPNAWGLYDMHGNVWEWCNDCYDYNYYSSSPSSNPMGPTASGFLRVYRGGSWSRNARYCRSASRGSGTTLLMLTTSAALGFRVVRRQ